MITLLLNPMPTPTVRTACCVHQVAGPTHSTALYMRVWLRCIGGSWRRCCATRLYLCRASCAMRSRSRCCANGRITHWVLLRIREM